MPEAKRIKLLSTVSEATGFGGRIRDSADGNPSFSDW
jgi:hypothetical protein